MFALSFIYSIMLQFIFVTYADSIHIPFENVLIQCKPVIKAFLKFINILFYWFIKFLKFLLIMCLHHQLSIKFIHNNIIINCQDN